MIGHHSIILAGNPKVGTSLHPRPSGKTITISSRITSYVRGAMRPGVNELSSVQASNEISQCLSGLNSTLRHIHLEGHGERGGQHGS